MAAEESDDEREEDDEDGKFYPGQIIHSFVHYLFRQCIVDMRYERVGYKRMSVKFTKKLNE